MFSDDSYLSKLNWRLLFIHGTYHDDQMLPLEKQAYEAEYGVSISFLEVKKLLSRINDLKDLLMLGNIDNNTFVRKSDEDDLIFNSTDVIIELFDSSYWTIAANKTEFIEKVTTELNRQGYQTQRI